MMPRTKEQFEEIRISRKMQIMNAAMELFAKEGYGHVSIATLAKHAGISKGLLYNYFESKEDLLKEILNSGIEDIMEYFDQDHNGVLTQEEFIFFIRRTFQLMHENKEFWSRFFGIIIQPNVLPFLKESALMRFMDQYFSMFEEYFRTQGFKDPALEVMHLSVIIEGLGIMMIFYGSLTELPHKLFEKFEERIINTYTLKHEYN